MKKLIALLLALLVLAAFTTVCFAENGMDDGDSPIAEEIDDPDNPTDSGLTSPETGAALAVAGLVLVFALAGAAVSGKKLAFRNK